MLCFWVMANCVTVFPATIFTSADITLSVATLFHHGNLRLLRKLFLNAGVASTCSRSISNAQAGRKPAIELTSDTSSCARVWASTNRRSFFRPSLSSWAEDLLAHGFELLSLLIAWLGVESIFQCPHVVVHGASLLCSGTPYHTLVGIATGSGENYQFRHIFFRSVLVGVHFAGSVGDAVFLKSFSQGEPAPSAPPGTLPAPAYYDPRKVAQVPHGWAIRSEYRDALRLVLAVLILFSRTDTDITVSVVANDFHISF